MNLDTGTQETWEARMRSLMVLLIFALAVLRYANYQLIARFNFICGQVMGAVDGVYETTASEEAKFRFSTMADVCFVRGWSWSEAASYSDEGS